MARIDFAVRDENNWKTLPGAAQSLDVQRIDEMQMIVVRDSSEG